MVNLLYHRNNFTLI